MRSILPLILLASLTAGCHCMQAPSVVSPDSSPGDSEVPIGDSEPEDTASDRYHSEDYADPEIHGLEAKLQTLPCNLCHGEDLTGDGTADSCDSCHLEGWREDCVRCHGGQDDETGAPPLHISGLDDGDEASFIPHQAHVLDTSMHAGFGCEHCHVLPTDVLTVGHLFVDDDSAGRAEADFSGGLDPAVGWDDSRTCVSSYCHGDGQGATGRVEHDDSVGACEDCHAGPASGMGDWVQMSGEHRSHLERDIACTLCHNDVVGGDDVITGLSQHVNGSVDVAILDDQVEWDGARCNGFCHDSWYWHWDQGWE